MAKWYSVDSSTIAAIAYDASSKRLSIKFKSNQEVNYVYSEVEPYLFENFLSAESCGKFFNQNIKDRYEFKKVVSSYKVRA